MEPNRRKRQVPSWMLLALLVLPALGIGFLVSEPLFQPELPQAAIDSVTWTSWSSPQMGITIEVPDSYVIAEEANEVFMSLRGACIARISWLSQIESDEKGLWADHQPISEIEMGGLAGQRYVYDHLDLFSGIRTTSHVVPWRGKFLAIEFCTRRSSMLESLGIGHKIDRELNDVERHMLRSIEFRPETAELRTTSIGNADAAWLRTPSHQIRNGETDESIFPAAP